MYCAGLCWHSINLVCAFASWQQKCSRINSMLEKCQLKYYRAPCFDGKCLLSLSSPVPYMTTFVKGASTGVYSSKALYVYQFQCGHGNHAIVIVYPTHSLS